MTRLLIPLTIPTDPQREISVRRGNFGTIWRGEERIPAIILPVLNAQTYM